MLVGRVLIGVAENLEFIFLPPRRRVLRREREAEKFSAAALLGGFSLCLGGENKNNTN